MSQGLKGDQIDAGFAWLGTQARVIHAPNGNYRGGYMMYDTQFRGRNIAAIESISVLKLPKFYLKSWRAYKQFGVFGNKYVYVYKLKKG